MKSIGQKGLKHSFRLKHKRTNKTWNVSVFYGHITTSEDDFCIRYAFWSVCASDQPQVTNRIGNEAPKHRTTALRHRLKTRIKNVFLYYILLKYLQPTVWWNNGQYLHSHERQEENTDEPGDEMQWCYMPFGKNLISD